jgi:hypothetical protein
MNLRAYCGGCIDSNGPQRLVQYHQHEEQATKVVMGIVPRTLRRTIASKRSTEAVAFRRFADQYAEAVQRLSEARDAYPLRGGRSSASRPR